MEEQQDKELLKERELPEELKKKFEQLKNKIEKFKKSLLEKSGKSIIGISLLPPEKESEKKEQINVLTLIDDSDQEKFVKEDIYSKLSSTTNRIAEDIDKNIKPQIMTLTDLREICFDAKYDILQAIAISFPLYDPTDLLAALKIAELHKSMTIKKFEKYIVSYVAAGSLFRGEKSNDIDIYIVVDDTDVKRMTRFELKEKLGAIIRGMAAEAATITGIKKAFHVQVYILTDFWESVKDAHPVIFTFLRDGVPLYDRGVFMPWKLLLKMGRIKPSPEAIDMQMSIGDHLLGRAKQKLLGIIAEDLFYAAINPAQAALMLHGMSPPTPRETIQLLEEIFVKKEKLLQKKYVTTLSKIFHYYKDIEHGKIKEISGKELDALIKETQEYLNNIKKLFEKIEKKRGAEDIIEIYDACISIAKDSLSLIKVKSSPNNVLQKFKKNFVDNKKVPERFLTVLKSVEKAKKDYLAKRLTKQEAEKVKKEARIFIRNMLEFIQRYRSLEIEKAKINFKYKDKIGEILLLENHAYIISDINAKDKNIKKATIEKDGSLSSFKEVSEQELASVLDKANIPEKVFIKEKTIEQLKDLFGKDVEILISS